MKQSRVKGLSEKGEKKLRELLAKYRMALWVRLGAQQPAGVEQMAIRLQGGAQSTKSVLEKSCWDKPKHRDFINQYVDKLVQVGFLGDRRLLAWQCAPLLLLRPGTVDEWRMNLNLRPVNTATIKDGWPLPNIDREVQDFADPTCNLLSLDFTAAWGKLPLAEKSRNAAGIITSVRGVALAKVMQGLSSSVM